MVLLLAMFFVVGTGCRPPDSIDDSNVSTLVGEWRLQKETGSGCEVRLPESLIFESTGIYAAPSGAARGATLHGGDWSLTDRSIRIQAADDAILEFSIALDSWLLEIETSLNCSGWYIRASP